MDSLMQFTVMKGYPHTDRHMLAASAIVTCNMVHASCIWARCEPPLRGGPRNTSAAAEVAKLSSQKLLYISAAAM
jgi:hypothetical protein